MTAGWEEEDEPEEGDPDDDDDEEEEGLELTPLRMCAPPVLH